MKDQAELAGLVRRVAAGDPAALGELYDRTAAVVMAHAQRVLRDRSEAEEVTSDTFFKVWRDAGRYDTSRGHVRTWLVTIARSKALDRWRRRQRDAGSGALGDTGSYREGDDPETARQREETRDRVRRALARLPPGERAAVECAFLRGKSHPQVAETLGIPLGTAKSRIRMGLRRLRGLLDPGPALQTSKPGFSEGTWTLAS